MILLNYISPQPHRQPEPMHERTKHFINYLGMLGLAVFVSIDCDYIYLLATQGQMK